MRITSNELIQALPEDSWLRRWMSIWELQETPRSFLLFVGLSTLGAVVGRKAYFDDAADRIWPMLNLLLIGKSGLGKTMAIRRGMELLKSVPKDQCPQIVAGKSSPERLHADLLSQPHAILALGELGAFFTKQKYMEGMVGYVTRLLDYEPIEHRTKSGGIERIEAPEVTLLGGSTIRWLQEMLPDDAMTGGFLPRFLLVFEEKRSKRCPLPGLVYNPSQRQVAKEARDKVFVEFAKLIPLEPEQMSFRDYGEASEYANWYGSRLESAGFLDPFAARAGEYILRLSLLNALACGRREILGTDVRAAISQHAYSLQNLEVIVIPYSQRGRLLQQILEAIGTQTLSVQQISKAMQPLTTSQDVIVLLASLVQSGALRRNEDGTYEKRGKT